LPIARSAEALGPRHLQYRFFIQVIAAEMLIDIEQNRVDFEKRHHGVIGVRDWVTGINRIAEGPGIAEIMTGRHGPSHLPS